MVLMRMKEAAEEIRKPLTEVGARRGVIITTVVISDLMVPYGLALAPCGSWLPGATGQFPDATLHEYFHS
jgi:hypothetical protein